MVEGFYHTCNQCGYTVRTTGNFGFYTNKDGRRVRYAAPAWRMPDDVDWSRPDNVVLATSYALSREERKKGIANILFDSWLAKFKRSKNKKAPDEHRITRTDESERKGGSGFCLTAYCPSCDKTLDLVTRELKGGVEVDYKPLKCPYCLSEKLVVAPDKETVIVCPRCKEGRLIGKNEYHMI